MIFRWFTLILMIFAAATGAIWPLWVAIVYQSTHTESLGD